MKIMPTETVSQTNAHHRINLYDIFLLPNLMTLVRVALTPFIGYYLWLNTSSATLICVGLMAMAAVTDILDGILARKLNKTSGLGLILDPLADKFFAISLVIELVIFRSFPLWLAIIIIGRDILIVIAGVDMRKRTGWIAPSLIAGKYYFASVSILIFSYVIKFEFGELLMTLVTLFFLLLSSVLYTIRYLRVINNRKPITFADTSLYLTARVIFAGAVIIAYLYRLYTDKLSGILG